MPGTANIPTPRTITRLALDTNIWLDWLVFADAGVVPIQQAVARGAAGHAIFEINVVCRGPADLGR